MMENDIVMIVLVVHLVRKYVLSRARSNSILDFVIVTNK